LRGQEVPNARSGEVAGQRFSTRIRPIQRPDRTGFRGQVSAKSGGHLSPQVSAEFGPIAKSPPPRLRDIARPRRSAVRPHRLQAHANYRSDRKALTAIKRPSLLIIADRCRRLTRRGSPPALGARFRARRSGPTEPATLTLDLSLPATATTAARLRTMKANTIDHALIKYFEESTSDLVETGSSGG
jgi:hypothetical protein